MNLQSKVKAIARRLEAGEIDCVIFLTVRARQDYFRSMICQLESRVIVDAVTNDFAFQTTLRFPCFHILVAQYSHFNRHMDEARQFCSLNRVVILFDEDRSSTVRIMRMIEEGLKGFKLHDLGVVNE